MRGRGHMHGKGICMAGGMHACVAGQTATAADGTHPTGTHSGFLYFCRLISREIYHNLYSGIIL